MKPRGLVVHTVGVKGDTGAAAIRKFHTAPKPKGNGWRDIGYHFVIRKSGAVELGRPLDRPGAHLEGANDTWGVCMSGDGDSEVWTAEQWAALLDLAEKLCREQGWSAAEVVGHREGPARFGARPTAKRCPGRLVDMAAVRARLAARLAGQREDQDRS
jgi:N-acetylmuramoyl-L-alanine amidase